MKPFPFFKMIPLDETAVRPWKIQALLFAFGYLVVLFTFVQIWMKYPQLLYLYRDGEHNLLLSLLYAKWSHPFALTSFNPLEGMTSMLVAINPYLDPALWVFFTGLAQGFKILCSYSIYALEVMLSTLALGLALGFTRPHAFLASIGVCLFSFPPFNFFFGLAGWFAVSPMYAHALALSNLCLIACLQLGTPSGKNLFWTAILALLILAILGASVFYNAGMLLGTALALTALTLCSTTQAQFRWRVCAGLLILGLFYFLGVLDFYASAKAYMARFSEKSSFLAWQGMHLETIWDQVKQERFWKQLCGSGMYCSSFPSWPISLSTLPFHFALFAGAIAAGVTLRGLVARLGFLFALLWFFFLLYTVLEALGLLQSNVSASYLFLMNYSLCALFSLYLFFLPFQGLKKRFPALGNTLLVSLLALLLVFSGSHWLLRAFHAVPAQMVKLKPDQGVIFDDRHKMTPLIQELRQRLALRPGQPFQGLVATLYGTAQGSLRSVLGVQPQALLSEGQRESLLSAAAESGSTHDLLDLWTFDIPTLAEYGQGISRPLMFYISKFLSVPMESAKVYFALPRFAQIDVLRALGVRFIVIDLPLAGKELTLRGRIPAGAKAQLFLYELASPNLGNYSPVRLLPLKSPRAFYERIQANPRRLESEAYVDAPFAVKLVPASSAVLRFVKGGVHVSAKSQGTSALLLPLQYSHCYQLAGPSAAKVKVLRANLIHTLLIFQGDLDLDLQWKLRWGQSYCRRQDVRETAKLSI